MNTNDPINKEAGSTDNTAAGGEGIWLLSRNGEELITRANIDPGRYRANGYTVDRLVRENGPLPMDTLTAAKRVGDFIIRRRAIRGLDQAVIAGLDGNDYELLTEDLITLIKAVALPDSTQAG